MKLIIFSTFFIYLHLLVIAQQTDLQKFKKAYPKDQEVFVIQKNIINISIENDSLVIEDKNYEEQLILSEEIKGLRQKSIQYNSFTKINDLEAYTLTPNAKGKYKKHKVKEFKVKDVLGGAIFHDDTKEINFYFSNIEQGSKIVHSYSSLEKEPRFLNGFFFESYHPIHLAEFIITAPKNVTIGYQYFNIAEEDLTFEKIENKGIVTYKWTKKNIPALKYEQQAPNPRYYMPHIIPYIKDYTINGEKKRLLTDVTDLYNWYYSLTENVNQKEDPILKSIADSVTANATTETEKVKNVFYWVQDNIKYVAFEAGLGGFIPREATYICEKRYGDCKDMASIITTMLKMVGIKSYLTWIGSNHIPYNYTLPTPAVDNHMIATYIDKNGKHYFLDATGQHTPFGYPTSFIQGKEALIGKRKNDFEIAKVPIIKHSKNKYSDKVVLEIVNGKVIGTGTAEFSGYQKINMTQKLSSLNEREKTEYLNSFFTKGHNKFLLDSQNNKFLNDRDKNFVMNYAFNIQDYARINEDEIYINLNLDKNFSNDFIEKDRENMIQKKFHGSFYYENTLKIPEGYYVEYLPENEKFENEKFNFSINYTSKKSEITLISEFTINHLLLEKNDFENWNKCIRLLSEAYNDVIILKKKTN